jgi:hypothetical protein
MLMAPHEPLVEGVIGSPPQPLLKARLGGVGEAMPPPLSEPLLSKNGLGQESMDPLRPINDLGHH